ncbi:hypothetical protein CLV36_102388 [Laceyella sediminis]|jgi:hypothetical protein|uniref:Uncharacterized protein n=2 Tax=Laceyella TaxID=292635 RepID=A0AA45WRW3_9BACL|nr:MULTISPECIES: hypothetical protein [Laceyella]PRZ16674.1 hypothetical protein CLV36_102388 [Laceyella sediminis]SMP32838.1 hypothetical protein SAMN06265361_10954 [Laceyella tengchongensis]
MSRNGFFNINHESVGEMDWISFGFESAAIVPIEPPKQVIDLTYDNGVWKFLQ